MDICSVIFLNIFKAFLYLHTLDKLKNLSSLPKLSYRAIFLILKFFVVSQNTYSMLSEHVLRTTALIKVIKRFFFIYIQKPTCLIEMYVTILKFITPSDKYLQTAQSKNCIRTICLLRLIN